MADTRSGFWLLLAAAALTVAVIALVCAFGHDEDRALRQLASAGVEPSAILLPIVGILLVSSEWSQRTAVITFTLVPNRPRVLAAKLLAGIALALLALVIAWAIAAIGTAIAAPDVSGAWRLRGAQVGQLALYLTTALAIGVGFGAALLSSAPAIVLSFALPIAVAALGAIPALNDAIEWVDSSSFGKLSDHLLSAGEWARAGTSLALWMLVPLAIGLWRVQRSEIA